MVRFGRYSRPVKALCLSPNSSNAVGSVKAALKVNTVFCDAGAWGRSDQNWAKLRNYGPVRVGEMGMQQQRQGIVGDDEIAVTYARAIEDAVAVICAQIAAAEKVGDDAAADINRSLDQMGTMKDQFAQIIDGARDELNQEVDRVVAGSDQTNRIKELQDECKAIEDELFSDLSMAILGIAANIQFQDIQRQILEEVSQIVRDLGAIDLSILSQSHEGASVPRKILENASARYVMQLQRSAHAQALGETLHKHDDEDDVFF